MDDMGGFDDFTGETDPGLPGDDLILLAMLDDEERARRAGKGAGYASGGGCCGCALPLAMVAFALARLAW